MTDLSGLTNQQLLTLAVQQHLSTQNTPSSTTHGSSAYQQMANGVIASMRHDAQNTTAALSSQPKAPPFNADQAWQAFTQSPYSLGNPDPNSPANAAFNAAPQQVADRAAFGAPPAPSQPPQPSPLAGMSNAQLRLAAQQAVSEPQMSAGEDAARTVPGAIARGAAGVVGLPGDLMNLTNDGIDWGVKHGVGAVQDALGYRGGQLVNGQWTPDKGNPYFGSNPVPQDYLPWQDRMASSHVPGDQFTGSGDVNQAIQSVAGAYHVPQTWAGRTTDTAGQMLPAALLPGNAIERVARVALPTAGSSVAGELTHGQPIEPWARAAGALGGAGVQGGMEGLLAAPDKRMGIALNGITPQQIDAAMALRTAAARQGLNLSVPEAVQQVTGGATGAGRLQRVVESSQIGGDAMRPYFADRPDQVRSAVMKYADAISPPTSEPSALGLEAQKTAQRGLDVTRQGINAAADPHYAALPGQTIPEVQYAGLAADPAYRQGLADLRANPILNEPVKGLPDNDLSVVNEVVKRLDRNGQAAAATAMNPQGDNQLAAAYGSARSKADALASAVSGDWRAARDIGATGRQTVLDPLQAGPIGKIASTSDIGSQTGALFPANPAEGASAETERAVQLLAAQNPDIPPALIRQHVVNTLNQSTRALSAGPNQYGGAMFAKNLVGNAEQDSTLRGALGSDPQFDDLISALQATGKRERPGSMTAFNKEDQEALAAAPVPIKALGNLLDPFEYGKMLNSGVGKVMYRRNLDGLAQRMTAPPDQTATVIQQALDAQRGPALARVLLTLPGSQETK